MRLFLLCLVLSTGLWAKPQSLIQVHSRAKFDLSNIFYSYQQVNGQDYGIPSAIAHAYTINVTYSFPSKVSGKSTFDERPAGQSCQWGVSRPYPAYTYIEN